MRIHQSSKGWSYWEHPSERVPHNGVGTSHNQMNYLAEEAGPQTEQSYITDRKYIWTNKIRDFFFVL